MGRLVLSGLVFLVSLMLSATSTASELHKAISENDYKKVANILKTNPDQIDMLDETYKSPPLNFAVLWERKEICKLLIEKGANINGTGQSYGKAPLHWSVWNEDTELMTLLLDHGANVNQKDWEGNKPLYLALEAGHKDHAEILVKHGADTSIVNLHGQTLMHAACKGGITDYIPLLVSKGLDPNKKDHYGRTPLHEAVLEKKEDIVSLYLRKGYYSKIDRSTRNSLLYLAASKSTPGIVKLIIKGGNIDIDYRGPYQGKPILNIAIYMSSPGNAILLINNGADVNLKDDNGLTPLHEAVGRGGLELVELLIAKKADVNAKDNKGQTPLHYAWEIPTVLALIKKGANVNAKDNSGMTPLCNSVFVANDEMIKVLVKNGADLNVIMFNEHERFFKHGKTPLQWAVNKNDLDMVSFLLESGADPNLGGSDKKTALHIAIVNGSIEMVKLLLRNGAELNANDSASRTPLFYAVENNNVKMASFLLDNGGDLYGEMDRGGPIAVHIYLENDMLKLFLQKGIIPNNETLCTAVEKCDLDRANILIEHGADVNVKCGSGVTLLQIILDDYLTKLSEGLPADKLIRLLVENGADVNGKFTDGRTSLHYAAEWANITDLAGYFISKGADTNAKDKYGMTPLHFAVLANRANAAKILLENGADPNLGDNSGVTPAYLANESDDNELRKLFPQKNSIWLITPAIAAVIILLFVWRRFRT